MSLLSLAYSYFILYLEIPDHSELLFTRCSEHTVHGPVTFLSSRLNLGKDMAEARGLASRGRIEMALHETQPSVSLQTLTHFQNYRFQGME